jgi:hypothetical protein
MYEGPILKVQVFYIWPVCEISIPLPYSGMSGREVAVLVSFHVRVCALQENKMTGEIENYSKFEIRAVVRLFACKRTESLTIIFRGM